MLTEMKIRHAKPREKPYKLYDSQGLFLQVYPNGSKLWRFKYVFAGKHKLISLGRYPVVSLAKAREKRNEARQLLLEGRDPSIERQKRKAARLVTFARVANEWYENMSQKWTKSHADKVWYRMNKYAIRKIGKLPIADITTQDVVRVVRDVEKLGYADTARRVFQVIRAVMKYAMVMGYIDRNVADALVGTGILPSRQHEHMPAPTDPAEVGRILRMLEEYNGSFVVKCAIMLAPLLFVRPGELVAARWEEINWNEKTWEYKVSKTHTEHIVPLSRQALRIFRELYSVVGHLSEWCFPAVRNPNRHITTTALVAALRRLGIDTRKEITTHGWRAVARTLLHEKLAYEADVIEHQLGHRVPDRLGAAYNRTRFLEQRRRMMQDWADYLDALKKPRG